MVKILIEIKAHQDPLVVKSLLEQGVTHKNISRKMAKSMTIDMEIKGMSLVVDILKTIICKISSKIFHNRQTVALANHNSLTNRLPYLELKIREVIQVDVVSSRKDK